jgi:hypothetical protein
MSRDYYQCNAASCRRKYAVNSQLDKYELAIHYLRTHATKNNKYDSHGEQNHIPHLPVDQVIDKQFTRVKGGSGRL